jgi:hypothetical protein
MTCMELTCGCALRGSTYNIESEYIMTSDHVLSVLHPFPDRIVSIFPYRIVAMVAQEFDSAYYD